MIPKRLEKRNQNLYDKLVPLEGKADTLEGEMIRAINRILYRFYNDGDYWYCGYGTETAGPAETFLRQIAPIDLPELPKSYGTIDEQYESLFATTLEKIVTYVESRKELTPNRWDMLKCKPQFTNDEDKEEDW